MAFIVEMHRVALPPVQEFYSVGFRTWEQLVELGRQFGWEPAGTEPDPYTLEHIADYMKWFRPDYEPEQWDDAKVVTAADAAAWAAALRRAAAHFAEHPAPPGLARGPALLRDDMSPQELLRVNAPVLQAIEGFARFLDDGKFRFEWDD